MSTLRACLIVLCLLSTSRAADQWPQWRGPHGNGVADGAGYPVEWGEGKHIVWQLDLPGVGASTPVVWGERIYLSCADETNRVLCLNLAGVKQWDTELGAARKGKHAKATGANPSPATDGERLYAYFKSGDLAAIDLSGNVLWRHNLQQEFGEDTLWWDLGTSPVLTRRHVIVAVMQTGNSFLAAFDKASGKLAWKVDRNLDAPEEAAQSYSTPVVVPGADGAETLVVVGADHVTGHDAANGKELWRVGGLNPEGNRYFRSIASPVVDGDTVVAPYARGNSLTAVTLGGKGDVARSHIRWSNALGADVPTPAARDGKLYLCTDKGKVHCLDIATGDELWSLDLPRGKRAISASPVLADGKLYIVREDGTTVVVGIDGEPKVLAENTLDGLTYATPVFVNGRILIRTVGRLYCVGG